VRPQGEARPLWKVLRVLGTMLALPGFDADTSEDVLKGVLADAGDVPSRLRNRTRTKVERPSTTAAPIERVADVPIYFADPLVRRAESLQQTADARAPKARVNRTLLDMLGIAEGAQVKVKQGRGEAVLAAVVDAGVPPGVVRIAAAHASTCGLDGLTGPVQVERA
jgi:NADH-quinone oxidoreductase subunit G